ncbi:MAG: DUF3987 domain-containing protein [Cyanobacteria bacterium CRU_2_1]|nr:DUF3987 domain-containing protein [Cyanobacteria bacterium CRU_2_1]
MNVGTSSLTRDRMLSWLADRNLPAIPVAPAFPASEYPARDKQGQIKIGKDGNPIPAFTGKNPSYLDSIGSPKLINHRKYQERLPSEKELKEWFADDRAGIGTLGGISDIYWIDLDRKQFESQEECDKAYQSIRDNLPDPFAWQARTQSGGYRVAVKMETEPGFTNFALSESGSHIGEVLGSGRFTVLPPTVGASGSYTLISDGEPVAIDSLEAIGIYSTAIKKARTNNYSAPRTSTTIPGAIPLDMLGCDSSRAVLSGEDVKGDRSESLTTAIKEWFGWERWAAQNGVAVRDSTESLAQQAGVALGLDEERVERILKTINPDDCQPACLLKGDETATWLKIKRLDKAAYRERCPDYIKAMLENRQQQSSGFNSSTAGTSPQQTPVKSAAKAAPQGSTIRLDPSHVETKSSKVSPIRVDIDPNFDLLNAVRELSNKNLSDSETDCEILEVARKSGYQSSEVRRTLEDFRKEIDFDDDLYERKQEIEKLSTYEDYDLPLKRVLHPRLVGSINKMAEYLGSKPSAFLITLLCVTSSLCRTGTQVQLQAATGGNAQSILFGGICGESGSAKSPTQKIILKPIFRLQNESESQYNAEKAEYDRARNAGEVDLEEPTPREYWTGNYTTEALVGIISKQRHGFAIYLDELSSVVTGMGQYKGGKGNDRETMLSGRDGSPIKVNRKTERLAAAQSSYSVVGATTPGVLRQLMKDFSDESGFWARFLWVYLPVLPMRYVDEDSTEYEQLQETLYEAYIRIGRYEPTVYKLSSEAKEIYRDWFDKLDERRLNESRPALRSVYNKAKFNTGEIALVLHVLNSAVEGLSQPPEEINKKTMKAAVTVTSFLMIQVNLIHRIGAEATGDLSAVQSKILELAKRKGGITAVDVRRGVRFFRDGKNSGSTEILKHFKALEKMGLGVLEGKRFTINALNAEE